jgi:hypothetical protein
LVAGDSEGRTEKITWRSANTPVTFLKYCKRCSREKAVLEPTSDTGAMCSKDASTEIPPPLEAEDQPSAGPAPVEEAAAPALDEESEMPVSEQELIPMGCCIFEAVHVIYGLNICS